MSHVGASSARGERPLEHERCEWACRVVVTDPDGRAVEVNDWDHSAPASAPRPVAPAVIDRRHHADRVDTDGMDQATTATIGAVLIVRDEADAIARCLASLAPLVDEIIVADTGSRDDTMEIAQSAGARVVPIEWDDDFAAARNRALGHSRARWVFSVDADEVADGDRAALNSLLAGLDASTPALSVVIAHGGGPDARGLAAHRELKLFRPELLRWRGRVHERLTLSDGREPTFAVADEEVLRLTHHGYRDEASVRAKARRNARLCALELDELVATSAPVDEVARVALDLGRSYLGGGESEAATVAFALVRRIRSSGPAWRWASDFLAHLALSSGRPDETLELVDELAADGAPLAYCNWLRALAFAERGDREGARMALSTIEQLVDLSGRPLTDDRLGALAEMLRVR